MNELQISNEENYFITKREEINTTLKLPTKSFLQNSYDFKKIAVLKNEPNFVMLIAGWCVQTSTLMQIKNPIDQFVKKDIFNMLTGYWSILGFEELVKAFELERFGVYKEKTEHYQLFDCNYISQVLKKYQNWKRENKIELQIEPLKTEVKMSVEEINKIMVDAVNNKYREFLNTSDISEPFNHIFKELVEIGKLKMPTKETPKMQNYYDSKLKAATDQILSEFKKSTHEEKSKRQEIKEIIKAIELGEMNQNYDKAKVKIEVRAKKLVLIDYFTKQKELNIKTIL